MRWLLVGCVVVLAVTGLSAFASRFVLGIVMQIGVLASFAYSYQLLFGCGGMLSFGHAVYFGLGAFFAAHVMNSAYLAAAGFPTELVPISGLTAGLVAGVLFGYPSSRRTGTPLAMVTLGIGELVAACFLMFPAFFGGEAGISTDRAALSGVFAPSYGRPSTLLGLVIVWAALLALAALWIARTPLGLLARAGRDNAERLAFLAHDPAAVRFRVMVLASTLAGGAGALSAMVYEIVAVESVGLTTSANVLLMTVVGGTASVAGPVVGAIVLTMMQTLLSQLTHAWAFYYGLLFIAVVLCAPSGLTGLAGQLSETVARAGWRVAVASKWRVGLAFVALTLSVVAIIEALFSRGNLEWISTSPAFVVAAALSSGLGASLYLLHAQKARIE
jgi:branched-chain amino acid transport system permease protein